MEHIVDYLMFLAKALTIASFLLVPLVLIVLFRKEGGLNSENKITVNKVNEKIEELSLQILKESLDSHSFKKKLKSFKNKRSEPKNHKTFLLSFNGDIKASEVSNLRNEITAVLSVAEKKDKVLLRLESAGGTLHGYGLAASQLDRIKDENIHLTVLVDKIAASGGYLMASVANEIIAAPFAIVGSIGVVAQMPNFNRLLKNNDVDFELLTAGKHKRSLTMFGENTEQGREKFQEELDVAHEIFKDFVSKNRPDVNIDKVATGEYWQATNAIEIGLVDRLATSDHVILENTKDSDVYEIHTKTKKNLLSRFFSA